MSDQRSSKVPHVPKCRAVTGASLGTPDRLNDRHPVELHQLLPAQSLRGVASRQPECGRHPPTRAPVEHHCLTLGPNPSRDSERIGTEGRGRDVCPVRPFGAPCRLSGAAWRPFPLCGVRWLGQKPDAPWRGTARPSCLRASGAAASGRIRQSPSPRRTPALLSRGLRGLLRQRDTPRDYAAAYFLSSIRPGEVNESKDVVMLRPVAWSCGARFGAKLPRQVPAYRELSDGESRGFPL